MFEKKWEVLEKNKKCLKKTWEVFEEKWEVFEKNNNKRLNKNQKCHAYLKYTALHAA